MQKWQKKNRFTLTPIFLLTTIAKKLICLERCQELLMGNESSQRAFCQLFKKLPLSPGIPFYAPFSSHEWLLNLGKVIVSLVWNCSWRSEKGWTFHDTWTMSKSVILSLQNGKHEGNWTSRNSQSSQLNTQTATWPFFHPRPTLS